MSERLKFKIGFTKHLNLGNYESETFSLEAEYLRDEMSYDNAFAEIIGAVHTEVKIHHPTYGAFPVEQNPNFESLPWREFKSRKGAWIFTNESGAEELRTKLEKVQDKTLEIGDYKYTISGDQGQFISRFRKAEQEAR